MKTKSMILSVIAIFIGLLFSCVNPLVPFDQSIVEQLKDFTAPEISVLSPEQGETYSSTVVVSGTVSDTSDAGTGGIASVSYEVLNTEISGTAEIAEDNSFTFTFNSLSGGIALSGSISIRITAVDWNGNSAEYILKLDNGSGAFKYFEVEAGNKSAEIMWNAIPLTESYAIFYTNDGTEPTETNGFNVSVPSELSADSDGVFTYTINGLSNGDLYRFRIIGNSSDGNNNLSGTKSVIPLSPYYLYPSVRTGYDKVTLDWRDMEGADSYRVYRSDSVDGTYQDVSGLVTSTKYTDKNLTPGNKYFYRIVPAVDSAVFSVPAYASPGGFKDAVPQILSSASAMGALLHFVIEGDYAYGVDTAGGLVVYDIGLPEKPVRIYNHVAEIDGQSCNYSYGKVIFYKNYLYLTCNSSGQAYADSLLVYDLSNPAKPEYKALYKTDLVNIFDFVPYTVSDSDYLYIGSRSTSSYINVLDISNPDSIKLEDMKSVAVAGSSPYIKGMMIHNDRLYFTNSNCYSNYDLYIYDLTSPTAPLLSGNTSLKTMSSLGDLYVTGASGSEIAYVVAGNEDFEVFDVSDPLNINILYSSALFSGACSIDIHEGVAYIAYENTSYIRGLSLNPYGEDGTYNCEELFLFLADFHPCDLFYNNGNLYAAAGEDGFFVIGSVKSTGILALENEVSVTGNGLTNKLDFCGHYAYSASGDSGISVFDISNPESFDVEKYVDPITGTGSGIIDVAVHGNYLYASNRLTSIPEGIFIYDISDHANPELKGSCMISRNDNLEMETYGNYLCALRTDILSIFNMENPETPEMLSSLVVENSNEIKVMGDFAYITCTLQTGASGIVVVDLSDPQHPRIVGSCETGNGSVGNMSLVLTDSRAYIGSDKLYVVDITDPDNLDNSDLIEDGDGETGDGFTFWDDSVFIYGIDTDGRFLFMSVKVGSDYRIAVADFYNPDVPVLVCEIDNLGSNAYGHCRIDGEYLYVGCKDKNIRCFKIVN